ncbi:MAG: hypothetical protein LBQ84_01645 [Flavobacteriaceae bacterium]|jgi:hypothetical protein|nr:hypothetical protein [Flavobacteriaceae bacterium]
MKKEYRKYWVLFIASLAGVMIIPIFMPYGGITSDTLSYFKLAKDFPHVKNSLFPVGYPILLKIGHFFTGEFYFSSRIIGILSYALIGIFSYYKRFYFRETVIILTCKFFMSIYTNSISEDIFLTILYFQIYYFHEYLSGNKKGIRFILPITILTIYMVMVRYSGVYIYCATGLFFLYYTLRNNYLSKILSKSYFYYLLFSFLGIGVYLVYNYMNFGGFFGEQTRSEPDLVDIKDFTYENLLGVINVVNPFFSINLLNVGGTLASLIEVIVIGIDVFFLLYFLWFYKKHFKVIFTAFHGLLVTLGGTYLFFMFCSEYIQGIERLNTRMLAPSSLLLCYSFVILYYKAFPNKTTNILLLGVVSLLYNVAYQLKTPVNYLAYKTRVEKIVKERNNIQYFYDDTENEKIIISTYKIPFIKTQMMYIHPYIQSGYINANIVRTIDPEIILLSDDNRIKNKSLILYNSEIK